MTAEPHNRQESEVVGRWRGAAAAALLVLLFLIAAVPLIWRGYAHGRGASDQFTYHLGPIRDFAAQWPHFDFSDYTSATTPGYHLTVAAVARFVTGDLRWLQLAGAVFTVGLLATLGAVAGRRAGAIRGIVLCLPAVCSLYVFASGVWLLPDNAGWWGVTALLLVALRPRVDVLTFQLAALLMFMLVIVRQSDLWVAVPLCVSAFIGNEQGPAEPLRRKWARVLIMLLMTAPAVCAVARFMYIWGGFAPPNQRPIVGGTNGAGPAVALGLAGSLGVFFLPVFAYRLKGRAIFRIVLLGAVVGLIIGAAPVSTYNLGAGRFSGIWNAVPHLPTFGNRSPVIVGLSTLGGATIALWLAVLPIRERRIWISTIVAFGVVQVATRFAFQRYDEPLVLIAAVLSLSNIARRAPRWAMGGPLLLAGVLAAITAISLR